MKSLNIICVIPSRLQSTRLPRKPLLPIQGQPMIQRVYECAFACDWLTEVIVATDSNEIAQVITDLGGHAVLTDTNIPNGSERVAFVAHSYPDADVVINLQGDEPFIKPSMLKTLVQPYLDGERPDMTTLAFPLAKEKYHDPGAVKVLIDQNQHAIYFSRAPIPYYRADGTAPVYNHMGLYAFRRDFLLHYTTLSQTPLDKVESLEQLRVIEHGFKIRVQLTTERTLEINTPEEYEAAQHFISNKVGELW